jgi:predicted ester cyclase
MDELLGEGMSLEDEKAHLEGTHAAFGDIEFTVDGMIAEGTRLLSDGQLAPSTKVWSMASLRRGKRMTFHGVVSLRIVGGKIVRFDGFSDIPVTLSKT